MNFLDFDFLFIVFIFYFWKYTVYNFNLFRFKKSTENGIPFFFLLLVQKLSVVKKTGLYLQFSKKEKAHVFGVLQIFWLS